MLKAILKRWSDWTGDEHLTRAIRNELRSKKLAVHAAEIREVRLVAIERPGWVQVRRFHVDTLTVDKKPVTLLGLARDDGRKNKIDVMLTTSRSEFTTQLDDWSDGLIRRG